MLDADHYDLQKVKERILEYLAVRKLAPDKKGPILASSARPAWARPRSASPSPGRWGASSSAFRSAACGTRRRSAATGAPTSARCPAGSSRASAAPAPAIRSSCWTRLTSSARTSAATRGRAAGGARPGAELTPSPITTWRCRSICPSVMFIATANMLDTIPPRAARPHGGAGDSRATPSEEKLEIAKRYLVPQQIAEHGLDRRADRSSPTRRIATIISEYTREAGVRNLEREIATVMPQGGAVKVAEGKRAPELELTGDVAGTARARSGSSPRSPERGPVGRGHRPGLDADAAATLSSSRPRRCPARAT